MNNFTKEELNILYEFLSIACEQYQEPDYIYELRDKIKSIIDNYESDQKIIESLNYIISKAREWKIDL